MQHRDLELDLPGVQCSVDMQLLRAASVCWEKDQERVQPKVLLVKKAFGSKDTLTGIWQTYCNLNEPQSIHQDFLI